LENLFIIFQIIVIVFRESTRHFSFFETMRL